MDNGIKLMYVGVVAFIFVISVLFLYLLDGYFSKGYNMVMQNGNEAIILDYKK